VLEKELRRYQVKKVGKWVAFAFIGLVVLAIFVGESEEKNPLSSMETVAEEEEMEAILDTESCAYVRELPEFLEAIINQQEEITNIMGKARIVAVTPVGAPEKYTEIIAKGRMGEEPLYIFQRMGKGCETIHQKIFMSTSEVNQLIKRNGLKMR